MSVLLIDNYDSFTYNLAQALWKLGAAVSVRRNDALSVEDAIGMAPSHLVISPGPGRPEDAGRSVAMIRAFLGRIPILGVCLGHQALAFALGARIGAARELRHGEPSAIHHDGQGVFSGLPAGFVAGRYHSLAVHDLPDTLAVSAKTEDDEVMGVRHHAARAVGVQFHPESVLTPQGPTLLNNFLRLSGGAR